MNSAKIATYRPTTLERVVLATSIWALCLLTFELPGRVAPEATGTLDPLALAKVAVRFGVLIFFTFAWRWNPDQQGRWIARNMYWPLLAFIAWALLSVLWSPLRTVSFGQAVGLASLVMLSAWITLACCSDFDAAYVVKHVWAALLMWCLAVLIVNAFHPDLSGLDRFEQVRGANGMVKPTAAGATAGLGFVLTLIAPKLIRTFRLGWALLPALAVFATLLFLSKSRTALAMTAGVTLFALPRFFESRVHAKIMMIASAAICIYLLSDPGFRLLEDSLESVSEYVSREQTNSQLIKISGRSEMWAAVWDQFKLSPWIGHGYFVTSETGKLNVWDGPANHTAHNVVLQVLVSTGLVGAAILAIAVLHIGARIYRLRSGDATAQRAFLLAALVGLWYFGWSQTCISFLGPIRPESVVFFALLGLSLGQAARYELRRQQTLGVAG